MSHSSSAGFAIYAQRASRTTRTLLVFALLAIFASLCCYRAEAGELEISEANVSSARHIEPFAQELDDPAGRYDILDVSRPPLVTRFHLAPAKPSPPNARCRWYRLMIDPRLEQSGPWVIYARTDSATLFEPTDIGYHAEWFGTGTPVASRRLQNGFPDVDLRHSDYGRILYIRITGPLVPILKLETLESASARERQIDLNGVFFLAIFGILTIAAVMFALITRVPAFTYYSIYMATQTLNQLNNLPFANRSLWPHTAAFPWLFDITYASLSPLSFVMFFRFALGTRTSPLMDRILVTIGIGGAVLGVACYSIDQHQGTTLVDGFLPLVYALTLLVVAGIAIMRWRQHYVSAGIYVIGLAGVVAGLATYPIFGTDTLDTADIGFTWEAIAFLAAIAYRLVEMTRDRESALAETVAAKEAVAQEFALSMKTTERFNEAFARFVPREFLEQLGRTDVRDVKLGDHVEREMTVLFCDIRAFMALSEQLTPKATFDFLNLYFGRVGPVVRANNGFVDKYVGDGVMALFPGPADDAIRAAISLHAEVRRFNEARAREGGQPIEVGVGLHRGPLMLATIGERERYDTTVIADVVNVAARLEGLTNIYGARIIVSDAVIANVVDRDTYNLRWLGELRVHGSAVSTSAYEVCDGDPAQLLLHKRATSSLFSAAMEAYRRTEFSTSSAMFAELVRGEAQDVVARFFMERSSMRAESPTAWDGIDQHDMKR